MLIDVTIKKPPGPVPADSARLYGELLEQARKEVLDGVIHTYGMDHELKVLQWEHNFSMNEYRHKVYVAFKLQGYTYKYTVDLNETLPDGLLAEAVGKHIAAQITSQLFKTWRK